MGIATWLARAAGVVYLPTLTTLLLMSTPPRLPRVVSNLGAHFCAFTLLAFLAAAGRWPIRSVVLAGLLVAYGLLVETAQLLVGARSVELLDYVENLLGIVAGLSAWTLWHHWRGCQESSL